MESNELQHWGIKGQRWGHRRFQNKDGSLTPAGRKRYDDDSDNDDRPAYQKQMDAVRKELAAEKAAQRSAKTVAKYDAKMAELEYKQAEKEAKTQEKAEKRKEVAKKVAIGAGIAAAAGLTYYGLKKYREKQAVGEDLAKKMLDNMKDFTVDDVAPKAERTRSSFKDIFNKAKTKLEDNIETGPIKDDSDRSRPKSSKPDSDVEIQDAPKAGIKNTADKIGSSKTIYDVDYEDVTSRGKSAVSGYLNSPIAGLLGAPKTETASSVGGAKSKLADRIQKQSEKLSESGSSIKSRLADRIRKQSEKLSDDQIKKNTNKIDDAMSKSDQLRKNRQEKLRIDFESKRETASRERDKLSSLISKLESTSNPDESARLMREIEQQRRVASTAQRMARDAEDRLRT